MFYTMSDTVRFENDKLKNACIEMMIEDESQS